MSKYKFNKTYNKIIKNIYVKKELIFKFEIKFINLGSSYPFKSNYYY